MIRSNKKDFISLLTFFGISVTILLFHLLTTHLAGSFPLSLIYPAILISGIWFIRKSLQFYFHDKVVTVTLVLFAFATNLFFLGVFSILIQPLLLFAFYSTLIFLTIGWHRKPSVSMAICLGITAGLIILIHPTGYFALLIPILWNIYDKISWKEKIILIRTYRIQCLTFISLVILINIIAFIAWKAKPGEIPFLNLKLPGVFTIGSRFLWNDLFSFDHGWLIYSPMLIIPALGFYYLAERERPLFFVLFLFCTLDIMAESCWTKLGNISVFGQIAFFQLYAFLVFPTAGFIVWILQKKRILQVSFFSCSIILIVLNLFQASQYREGIIPSSGMTGEIYCMVFGRTKLTDKEKLRISEITGEEINLFRNDEALVNRTLVFYNFEHPNPAYRNNMESEQVKYGRFAMRMDKNMRFSPAIDISYHELTNQPQAKVRISAAVFCKESLLKTTLFLVLTSNHNRKNYRYRILDAGQSGLKPGQWKIVAFDYLTPLNPLPQDRLQGYIFYTGNQTILIDNLRFDLFEQKK